MAHKRLSMRKIREVLRLTYECGMSQNKISQICNISRPTVKNYICRLKFAGLEWPLPERLNDELELEKCLFPPEFENKAKRKKGVKLPDWPHIHKELKRKGVTRELLWQEYKIEISNGIEYSQFCASYKEWLKGTDLPMRQTHKSGDKLFVDYAGHTVPVVDSNTGETRNAQIFVAVMGASNYTFAEATWSQELPNWIGSHIRCLEFLGGVPNLIVPDNLKSGVSKACLYEPDLNKTYNDMATHYSVAVMPARPYKPKDKAKAENGVLIVERQILAAIRDKKFFSLDELNQEIRTLLLKLNSKPFQKLEGTRESLFKELDKPALKPLPTEKYQYADFKIARVNIDYHVEFDRHYYSVPYQYVRKEVELRFTLTTVEMLYGNKRIASHRRSSLRGRHTTLKEHMPKSHQKYSDWTPSRIANWASTIGPFTSALAQEIMKTRSYPEQGFRSCLGILRLGKSFGNDRLEKACERAVFIKSFSFKTIKTILQTEMDKRPLKQESTEAKYVEHQNIRGVQLLK